MYTRTYIFASNMDGAHIQAPMHECMFLICICHTSLICLCKRPSRTVGKSKSFCALLLFLLFFNSGSTGLNLCLFFELQHRHTHTHMYIYMYEYIIAKYVEVKWSSTLPTCWGGMPLNIYDQLNSHCFIFFQATFIPHATNEILSSIKKKNVMMEVPRLSIPYPYP